MTLTVFCAPRQHLGPGLGWSRQIHVRREFASVAEFDLMCEALDCDVQSARGAGSAMLALAARVASGEPGSAEVDGNGWFIHLSPDQVWFEGLYDQGAGGHVPMEVFRAVLSTIVEFLSDSLRKPLRRSLEEVRAPAANGGRLLVGPEEVLTH